MSQPPAASWPFSSHAASFSSADANSTYPMPLRSPVSLSDGRRTLLTVPYWAKASVSCLLTSSSPRYLSKPLTNSVDPLSDWTGVPVSDDGAYRLGRVSDDERMGMVVTFAG